jgi:hypothetical protein
MGARRLSDEGQIVNGAMQCKRDVNLVKRGELCGVAVLRSARMGAAVGYATV